jgi:hypothetical protein
VREGVTLAGALSMLAIMAFAVVDLATIVQLLKTIFEYVHWEVIKLVILALR